MAIGATDKLSVEVTCPRGPKRNEFRWIGENAVVGVAIEGFAACLGWTTVLIEIVKRPGAKGFGGDGKDDDYVFAGVSLAKSFK